MSRLIDKLTRLRQAEPQPIGFAALGRTAAEKLRMQLIVSLSPENQNFYSEIGNSADAAVIAVAKPEDFEALGSICQEKDGIPAGGWLRVINTDTLQKATGTSCDFMVFPSSSSLSITRKDKLGRILELDSALSDGLLRTVNDLPVDAVLVSGQGAEISLTLNRLMLVRRLVYLINKPILVSVPGDLTASELQALWDLGINGVMVEAVDKQSIGKLAELHREIEKLTPSAARKKERTSPLLPHMRLETPTPQEDGEEEEEEE